MIDYSVTLRINPQDKQKPAKAYATPQCTQVLELEEFAEHIATHGSKYDEGDITAVLIQTVKCLKEMLLAGNKVKLGKLGDFWISLTCEGAESLEEFSDDNIKGVKVLFTPGSEFENMVGKAQFRTVTTRAVQAAALKAVKAGEDSVDLAALKKPAASGSGNGSDSGDPDDTEDGGDDGNGSSGNGGGTSSGGDSGSGSGDDNAGL